MKKFLIILFLILFNSNVFAEVIKKIVVSGNERVSDETVKVYGDISINQNVDNLKINQIIKNLYSTNFFEDIKVSISNETLFINLVEYPVINDLVILVISICQFLSRSAKPNIMMCNKCIKFLG